MQLISDKIANEHELFGAQATVSNGKELERRSINLQRMIDNETEDERKERRRRVRRRRHQRERAALTDAQRTAAYEARKAKRELGQFQCFTVYLLV